MGLRTGLAALVVGVAALAAAGCGPKPQVSWTVSGPIRIDRVSTVGGGRTLLVAVEVPDGGADCARNPHGEVSTVEHGTVYVNVTVETRSLNVDYHDGACRDERTVTVKVPLDAPLGDRTVMVNNSDVFTAEAATAPALRRCGENGCDPTPPRCTADSYWQAVASTDTPKHTSWDEVGCDGEWLLLELSQPTGPACGGEPKSCAPVRVQRWIYRAEPSGWRPVAIDGGAGCGPAHRVVPELPQKLCVHLKAVDDPATASSSG
jgi:hypothetical protein